MKKKPLGDRYAIIADHQVAKIYGKNLLNAFEKKGLKGSLLTFQAGEKSKNLQTIEKLLSLLLKKKFTRSDAILALGGGVTGDIAGFTASIFMRGIAFAQIPTTLLAMVDSSIGGKTGVNLTEGKNLAGTYYQPKNIWIDPNLLETLPREHFLNGFAEIIKYGIIKDSSILDSLEKDIRKNRKLSYTNMNKLIIQCIKIKASIIEKDPNEKNERMLLNYGHTVGHAIERLSNYKIDHGKAVAFGIISINKIALELDLINKKSELRIKKLLNSFGLLKISSHLERKVIRPKELWKIMEKDKKMQKSKINFIIIKNINNAMIYNKINKNLFIKYFPKKGR